MQESKRGIFGFIVVTISIALIAILVLTQLENDEPETRVPAGERTPAHELAIFAEGKYVSEKDERVKKFEEFLEEISSKTSSTKRNIANLSTDTVIELRNEKEVDVTLDEFLEKAKELSSETNSETKFEEIASKLKIIFSKEGSEA